MLIGYARVSTHDQTLNLQLDSLKSAGCSRIFEDHISGTKAERKGLTDAISHLRAGDTLVVWRLDRLGRSLRHLIDIITELEQQGIGFKSLHRRMGRLRLLPEPGSRDSSFTGSTASASSAAHSCSSSFHFLFSSRIFFRRASSASVGVSSANEPFLISPSLV
jgi:hypothetical protein